MQNNYVPKDSLQSLFHDENSTFQWHVFFKISRPLTNKNKPDS